MVSRAPLKSAAGGVAIILLLLASFIIDVMMPLRFNSLPDERRPALLWVFREHLWIVLLMLLALTWQWRDRAVWGLSLIVGLVPVVLVAWMMLRHLIR